MTRSKNKFSSITQIIKFITGILSWVILVILVLIAAFLLYYFTSMKIYAQKGEQFKPFISLYTILTQSMQPNINPYDVIVDQTVSNPESIQIGDVITFVSSSSLTRGMTITHRVYDIKVEDGEYLYYTKGDDNLSPDASPAKYSNVLGKVLFKIPQLGKLQSFLATRGGWLIVVVIPALIIIISDILKLFRLKTAKNHVEATISVENNKKMKEEKNKKEIQKKLEERYKVEKTKTKIDVSKPDKEIKKAPLNKPKKEEMNEQLDMELPKLKEETKHKKKR